MKKPLLIILLIFAMSCKDENNTRVQVPVKDFKTLTSDYMTWWSYHYNQINLTLDFSPYDDSGKSISKDEFLKKLTSGNYITIALETEDKSTHYKLFKLNGNINKPIVATIKNTSKVVYKHFKMEGKPFPKFDVKTIDSSLISNASFNGKTTILKTWFIACKPCVAEFPELNELVEAYSSKKDIQFISLATDKAPQLKAFLEKKPFNYSVIAEQRNLIQEELNLQAYPTHLMIDEDGKIEKVFGKASEMISYLKTKH